MDVEKIKRFTFRQIALFCLLTYLCAAALNSAGAQSDKQTEENILGIPPGYTIIEGDIQMPKIVADALRRGVTGPEAGIRTTQLWPNGVIPFEFDANCGAGSTTCVSAPNQTAMLNAMAVLEAVANIDFRQCNSNACNGNYVHVQANPTSNNSPVGVQGGRQIINIVSWGTQFIIVHELLHTLGFFHEQSRPDRDPYVDVASLCANVTGGCMDKTYLNNFPIDNGATAYGYYDFDSVMHYDQCSFSRNDGTVRDTKNNLVPACPATSVTFPDGGITIRVKEPYNMQLSPDGVPWQDLNTRRSAIGQRTRLSALDRLTVSFLYSYPNWRFVDGTYTGQRGASNGTFLRPYQSLTTGINATPTGGTLWIQPGTYFSPRILSKNITLQAPLGDVSLRTLQGTSGETLAAVSAASFNGELASESIAAAFGVDLAGGTFVATSLPLPTTLGGVTIKITDSAGTERDAPLFFVSPGQINYLVPAGTSVGVAGVSSFRGDSRAGAGTVPITTTAPALFTANANGLGVPAAVALRVRGDAQIVEPLSRYDDTLKQFVPIPIDLGPEGDLVFLILFGTGFRAANSPSAVNATIGGENTEVLFAGAAPGFAGLDQANVLLPRSLAGKGEVSIEFAADNRSANAVIINVR